MSSWWPVYQGDGRLFLINAFVDRPEDEGGVGVGTCSFGTDRPWTETISVTELSLPTSGTQPGTAVATRHKDKFIVHDGGIEACIDTRPSWRYAGAFVPTGARSGAILWSSRWKSASPANWFTENYRYAAGSVSEPDGSQARTVRNVTPTAF